MWLERLTVQRIADAGITALRKCLPGVSTGGDRRRSRPLTYVT